jgi:hypothetical protein
MKYLLLITAIAMPISAQAGGPVIIEDAHEAEARPSSEGRWVVPVIVGLLIVGAIASGGGNDVLCQGPDDQPKDGGC